MNVAATAPPRVGFLTAILLLASLPSSAATADEAALTGRDLKAIRYVENAHGQLEEWTDRLRARLESGLGPRDPEPIVDGRAELQTAKIAVTYTGYVPSRRLAKQFTELAEAHAARLAALRERIATGGDASEEDLETYRELDARVDELIAKIRDWRAVQ